MTLLLKGILIGLLFGLPVGAVGALVVRQAFAKGFWAGFLTGLGSSAADCLYACVGAFGLTFVSDFLLAYQTPIRLAGSGLILCLGLRLLLKGRAGAEPAPAAGEKPGLFLPAFLVGITNPAAVLTFLFAFSWFGLSGGLAPLQGAQLAAGVFLGTCIWWAALSAAVRAGKRRWGNRAARWMDPVFGAVLTGFGLVILAGTFGR